MDLRDRIDAALTTKELDDRDFERCAYHFLKRVYPQLTLITGGTDLGRDADIGPLDDGPRLLVTTGPLLANLKRGIKRMKEEGVSITEGVVMATSRVVHGTERERLKVFAKSQGTRLLQVHDRSWLADELMGDGYWRRRLLEVTSELAVLVTRPFELSRYSENLDLVGREPLLQVVNTTLEDLILIGPPGIGKTRLLAEADRVVFLQYSPDSARLAEDLDDLKPALVVVEDAARRADDLRILQRMRIEERHRVFRVAATAWPDEAELVQDQLEKATPIQLQLLERPDMDRILGQLGVTGYWHRSAILDQAGGRPGWAVVLARTAVAGRSKSVFDGQALAREVERYLALAGDLVLKQRVLAHIALYDGIAEEDLGALARRLDMALPDVTRTLHTTTHNGILERADGTWRVRPQALRVALIERWFLAPDALEPLSILIRQYPDDQATFVIAALESALQGSRRGSEIGRKLAPELTARISEGDPANFRLLELYADLDEKAASWAVHERVVPALANPNRPESTKPLLEGLVRSAAERFQVSEAVHMLLDDALSTRIRTNDPAHPLRILGDAARRIVPGIGPDPSSRINIFNTSLQWLEVDPAEPRWIVFASLMESVLSPYVVGTWGDPGQPMTFVLSEGVDRPETLELIVNRLWPELDKRLGQGPDQAVIPLTNLLSDWVDVAQGSPHFRQSPTEAQQRAANSAVLAMVATLEARVRLALGLAVRMRRLLSGRLEVHVKVERDFDAITTYSVEALQGTDKELALMAKRWIRKGPKTVLTRIKGWERQLQLVGPGMTHERQVLGKISSAVPDAQAWAEETVKQGVEAGSAVFYEALLQRKDGKVPRWFSRALKEPTLRPLALQEALRPGVPRAIADKALFNLDKGSALAIRLGLLERQAPDGILSAMLRHRIRAVRAIAALDLGPAPTRRLELSERDQRAWEAAIVASNPEDLPSQFEYELGQALEYLARAKPKSATTWFSRRLKLVGKLGYVDALPRLCRPALQLLPASSKLKLLAEMPMHWRSLLFHEGLAGDDPRWVLEAVDSEALTVEDASQALQEVDLDTFKHLATELVRRGLDPRSALVNLETGTRVGNESNFYAELLNQSEDMARSTDPNLASIGNAGVERYNRLRDAALQAEHLERVFGI